MRFLFTTYPISYLGGIINHHEYLALGLKELGHTVDLAYITMNKTPLAHNTKPYNYSQYYKTLGSGYPFTQGVSIPSPTNPYTKTYVDAGWKHVPKYGIATQAGVDQFLDDASKYDAVIWHIPVSPTGKDYKGNDNWTKLYDHGAVNIAIGHDGNMPSRNPHLLHVASKFHAVVCVHESALESARELPIPRVLIPNGFVLDGHLSTSDYEDRDGWYSGQTWKNWKRVEELIRSVPSQTNTEKKVLAGGDAHYYKFVSLANATDRHINPDTGNLWYDEVILKGLVDYRGMIQSDEVFQHMKNAKLQIDPSWSPIYSKHGAHFNRTTVEAIINGAVPMATRLGMSGSKYFKEDQNYIALADRGATPKEYAEKIDDALNDKNKWYTIRDNNRKLVDMFDYRKVAQQYVDLVSNNKSLPIGSPSQKMKTDCARKMGVF